MDRRQFLGIGLAGLAAALICNHCAIMQFDNAVGMAGHRLVHRVVDDFGKQMMQRLFVGAANIHARPPTYRLQSFQDFNVGSAVSLA